MLSTDEISGEFCCQILRAQVSHYLSTANNWVKFFTGAIKELKEKK